MGRHVVHLLINHCCDFYTLAMESGDFWAQNIVVIITTTGYNIVVIITTTVVIKHQLMFLNNL